MFKKVFSALILSATAMMAAETVLASWDFAKEDVLTSSPVPFLLRHAKNETDGGAKIENGFLICTRAKGEDKPTGIQSMKGGNAAFSPQGAFKVTADFKFQENLTRQGVVAVLFDNKYVAVPNAKQAQCHKGFQIGLRVYPGNKFAPRAAFGFGTESKEVYGRSTVLENDKLHHLEIIFTGKGEVKFSINGQDLGTSAVPAGPIATATLPTVIGDRYGSTLSAFGGAIAKVEIIKLDDDAAAPAAPAAPAEK